MGEYLERQNDQVVNQAIRGGETVYVRKKHRSPEDK